MTPRDLQCKDVTAQLACGGALLPPSFERVADLGFKRGNGGMVGASKRDAEHTHSTQNMRERHPSGVGCPYTVSGSLQLLELNFMFTRREFLKKKKAREV